MTWKWRATKSAPRLKPVFSREQPNRMRSNAATAECREECRCLDECGERRQAQNTVSSVGHNGAPACKDNEALTSRAYRIRHKSLRSDSLERIEVDAEAA
jgi:hypothetical protein